MEYSMVYDVYDSKGVLITSLSDKKEADDLALEIDGYVNSDEVEYDDESDYGDRIVYSTK